METLKFRAWDDEEITEMTDSIEEHMSDQKKIENRNNDISIFFDDYWGCIIMQFIGLKDISDNDIFEDDICKCKTKNGETKIGIVTFQKVSYCLTVKMPDGKEHHWRLSGFKTIEIIGNIYENPEFLTPKRIN